MQAHLMAKNAKTAVRDKNPKFLLDTDLCNIKNDVYKNLKDVSTKQLRPSSIFNGLNVVAVSSHESQKVLPGQCSP